jgi:hypothetical protein
VIGQSDGVAKCWRWRRPRWMSETIVRHITHNDKMPPRLNILSPASLCRPTAPHASVASLLQPFLRSAQQPAQQRNASILSSLSDNSGAYNKKIRRGRGPSSGKGKTSGRGHKGQKAHGKVPRNFNGGQTPDIVVHGERGFENQCVASLAATILGTFGSYVTPGTRSK